MNWDDLRLFLGLARNGKISIAARNLHLDATTLIRRVKRLETALNCNLFELSNKGYLLTDHGKRLVHYIEHAERHILEAKNDLTDERQELSGTVRVSASEGFGSWVLAPALAEFTQRYPAICVELVANSGFLNINKREADIAILLEKPTKGLLYTKRLTDYRLNLYMHEDLVAEHGAPSSIEQLSPFNLVSYVPDLIYAPQLNFIEESLLSPLHALKSTSINAQFQMLRNKAGVGILPHFIAKNAHELQPVLQDKINITRTFWLATHRDVRHLARVNVFLDWLNDTVQQHADIF